MSIPIALVNYLSFTVSLIALLFQNTLLSIPLQSIKNSQLTKNVTTKQIERKQSLNITHTPILFPTMRVKIMAKVKVMMKVQVVMKV